jgi:vanillate O-demethylase ferredoxin subunit
MRAEVLAFHRWTGLTVGLVLAFMAATGICLTYRTRMEPAVYRDLLTAPACTQRVSVDELAAKAKAAHPRGELDYVRIKGIPEGSDRMPATQVRLSGPGFQDDVFFDPCSGGVLGQRGRYGGFFGLMESLHKFKFVKNGNVVAGAASIFFIVALAIGGVYLWWPRRLRCLKAQLVPPRVRGAMSWHRLVGIYASGIIGLSALTGLPQAFEWIEHLMHTKAPKVASAATAARLPMETFWRHAQSLVPDPAETLIHFPSKPRDPVEIFIIARDAPHANARTMLFLDASTDRVLRFTPYAQSTFGTRLYFWTLSWHTGQVGGVYGPFVLLTGALALLVLAWTGTATWLRRRPAKLNDISEAIQSRFSEAA